MKITYRYGFICLLLAKTLLISSLQVFAEDSFFTINGIVKDQSSKKKLEQVHIAITGTNISSITNEDGVFSIKINDSIPSGFIEFSHLGYYNLRTPFQKKDQINQVFYLVPNLKRLDEVFVKTWSDPQALIMEALNKTKTNYSHKQALLTGFYRETAKKRRNFIDISEAIIFIYKTSYNEQGIIRDRVQLHKGRSLMSQKKSDTLVVKLMGGPTLPVAMDFVKDQDVLFNPKDLVHYTFEMLHPVVFNDRLQYVVKFTPAVMLSYPLYHGIVYIDQQNLAFSRAEFSMDMSNRDKATRAILYKKPRGLIFKPEEVSYIVSYKQEGGTFRLNYVRNEIRFKCDWKRRLFSTNYTVVSEIIATDSTEDEFENIPWKTAFKEKESLSDLVIDYYDENFWGTYNIIEPSESLETAVGKLKLRTTY